MKAPAFSEGAAAVRGGRSVPYWHVGDGRPVLLANGIVGGPKLWSSEIAHFADGYRWLTWEYDAGGIDTDNPGELIERQVGDALAILDAESVEQTAIVGWSFGAKVAMELFRRAPRRVASLVLVGAVAGNPWEHRSIAGSVLPRVLRLSNRFGGALESVMTRAARWPETSLWARRLGVVSPTLSTELGSELADALGQIDFERVRTFLRAMETHDASDVLHAIDVPVLVISGDRDFASTREAAEHIVRSVRGAELMTVPGGSHFVHAEYPELVSLRIEKFFRERGYADAVPARRSSAPPPPPGDGPKP